MLLWYTKEEEQQKKMLILYLRMDALEKASSTSNDE